jgi:shikimate dehydrogenase
MKVLKVRELKEWPKDAELCVIGHPIDHSRSPAIFKHLGHPSYRAVEVRPEDVPHFFSLVKRGASGSSPFVGCNVTAPLKEILTPWLDSVSLEVQKFGGPCNCLVAAPNGALKGHNTDVLAAEKYFLRHMNKVSHHSHHSHHSHQAHNPKVLIWGAGGAAKAVLAGAIRANIRSVAVLNRSQKAQEDLHSLAISLGAEVFDPTKVEKIDFFIQARSYGATQDSWPQAGSVRLSALKAAHILDLNYNPLETPFLVEGKKQGCQGESGAQFLIDQAISSAELFFPHENFAGIDLMPLVFGV